LAVICPGAAHFNKRWNPEGFITTARSLINDASAFVVVHGGKADATLCGSIAENIGGSVANFAGSFSLSESAALLKLSRVVIANDSGLLHMAQSQKIPVVAIYGPTTRELGYFPLEENSTVIEVPLYCRPCTHNGLEKCPRKHFRCMNEITADQVITASLKYLN
jgi:ADP-heptose:LPS heptosyltransferase